MGDAHEEEKEARGWREDEAGEIVDAWRRWRRAVQDEDKRRTDSQEFRKLSTHENLARTFLRGFRPYGEHTLHPRHYYVYLAGKTQQRFSEITRKSHYSQSVSGEHMASDLRSTKTIKPSSLYEFFTCTWLLFAAYFDQPSSLLSKQTFPNICWFSMMPTWSSSSLIFRRSTLFLNKHDKFINSFPYYFVIIEIKRSVDPFSFPLRIIVQSKNLYELLKSVEKKEKENS